MLRFAIALTAALICAAGAAPADDTYVRLSTDAGEILLVMSPELAPRHVDNFTHLCRTGFYVGTAFHRVIPGFMIQGGDPNSRDDNRGDDGTGGPEWDDVLGPEEIAMIERVDDMLAARGYVGVGERPMLKAEFNTGHHRRGVLSMARSQSEDSAGSQFFICVADILRLDGDYTVFGRVVSGLDVVDAIVSAERDPRDNPLQPLRITGTQVMTGTRSLTDAEREAIAASDAQTSIE